MPSYFYECRKCCKVFTLVRKLEECEQAASCPDCSGTTTKQLTWGPFFAPKRDARRTNDAFGDSRNELTSGKGLWTARMIDCEVINCDTGIKISGAARIQAQGLELLGNRISIDIGEDGELHDLDTEIE